MIKYTHTISEKIDLDQEARRVYRVLDKLIPEADKRDDVDNQVRGAIYGEYTTRNIPIAVPNRRFNGVDLLKVVFDIKHRGIIKISSPVLTREQIESALATA